MVLKKESENITKELEKDFIIGRIVVNEECESSECEIKNIKSQIKDLLENITMLCSKVKILQIYLESILSYGLPTKYIFLLINKENDIPNIINGWFRYKVSENINIEKIPKVLIEED